MNVLLAADDLYPGFGGIAASTQTHAEALVRRGHRVHAMAGRGPRDERAPDGIVVHRVPAIRLGVLQTRLGIPLRGRLRSAAKWADVVHVNAPSPLGLALVAAARSVGTPSVMGVHVQVETARMQLPFGGALVGSLMRSWYARAFRSPDAVIAPTPFAARMASAWTGGPVEVVSNGLRVPRDVPSRDAARRSLPAAWIGAEGRRLLVYLGRLSAEKRPGDLLSVARYLPPDVRLIVAGTGPLRASLARRVDGEGLTGRVTLAGFVDDEHVPGLLAAADLFLMPSAAELQSIASLQAMAHGCPVAAAEHSGSAVPEWVAASRTGITYPPGDPALAARRITDLLADPDRLADLRTRAREYAEGHDIDAVAEVLERLYERLVDEHRPSGSQRS